MAERPLNARRYGWLHQLRAHLLAAGATEVLVHTDADQVVGLGVELVTGERRAVTRKKRAPFTEIEHFKVAADALKTSLVRDRRWQAGLCAGEGQ